MISRYMVLLTGSLLLYGCSTSRPAVNEQPEPPETVDFETMIKPPSDWYHMDEEETRFRGISSHRAYATILKGRSPEREVVVAVIDGGVDALHEDLDDVMWVNEDEIPGNGIDDDNNGYVDDIHGWNFIGGEDGNNVNHDTFELTRIYAYLHARHEKPDQPVIKEMEQYGYEEIKEAYEAKIYELNQQYSNIESLTASMQQADAILQQHFDTTAYSLDQVQGLAPTTQELNFAKNVMAYVLENDIDSTLLATHKKQIYEFAKYGYNPGFEARSIVGDHYEDPDERSYGNNDVAGPDPSHGTHVAGIIAAERDNGIGMDGVASGTRIMAVRAVPNGDERDKDVANAIRYAVDNGAHIINMSFGKSWSPYKAVVDEAVRYADSKGVLMVHGAGNDARNTDYDVNFPNDQYAEPLNGDTAAVLWLSVGATSWKPDHNFVAGFSNYGNETVDIFAPGVDIYSTMPDNKYKMQEGTSMAAPMVAGAAALIMAYYPELTAAQVRDLLMKHTAPYPGQNVLVPNEGETEQPGMEPFSRLSVSDGVLNVYKALQGAEKLASE